MNPNRLDRRFTVLLLAAVLAVSGGSTARLRANLAGEPQARGATAPDIVVTIPSDVLARAGIESAPARRGPSADGLRIPATVQPNAYRQVSVLATSVGRVTAVLVELGQRVAAGAPLIRFHSPEVADTETTYVAKQADLTYARQQIARLERLVAIGAASQQELDGVRAQQTSLAAEVAGARARLIQLGRTAEQVAALATPDAISPIVTLVAPMAATVTARAVNVGQTIEASAPLITLVDLDSVWVIGEAYERDMASIRVGSPATMTAAALPGETLRGQVSYIDPQIAVDSRTARVRVEVANPGGRLRLGMLVEMRIGTGTAEAILIPKSAVQTIGGTSVVYIVNPQRPGAFVERSVRLGRASGDTVEVQVGLGPGETVVTAGSFLVRSERDRANLGAPRPVPGAVPVARSPSPAASEASTVVDIAVTEKGFAPAEINVPANTRIRLRFTRRVEQTCATDVVFPALKIERPLPLGVPVIIDVPAQPPGRLAFACGMNMYKGQLVIK